MRLIMMNRKSFLKFNKLRTPLRQRIQLKPKIVKLVTWKCRIVSIIRKSSQRRFLSTFCKLIFSQWRFVCITETWEWAAMFCSPSSPKVFSPISPFSELDLSAKFTISKSMVRRLLSKASMNKWAITKIYRTIFTDNFFSLALLLSSEWARESAPRLAMTSLSPKTRSCSQCKNWNQRTSLSFKRGKLRLSTHWVCFTNITLCTWMWRRPTFVSARNWTGTFSLTSAFLV